MTTDDLFEKQWLLAYEANVKAGLPSVGAVDHIIADPGFGTLMWAGVAFDETAAIPMPAQPLVPEAEYVPEEYGA